MLTTLLISAQQRHNKSDAAAQPDEREQKKKAFDGLFLLHPDKAGAKAKQIYLFYSLA
ncbi:MAG: hypothetical protein GX975_05465 [Clostridiales bacterium]|nr:hypothetical protein [Clostridiales bacterium]